MERFFRHGLPSASGGLHQRSAFAIQRDEAGSASFKPSDQMSVQDGYLQEAFQSHWSNCRGVLEHSRVIGERAQWQINAADSIINTLIAKQSQRTADESK